MRALLVHSSPGTGKTTALANVVAKEQISARIVTGSLRLARELAAEHGHSLIEGRNPNNCQRHDVVRALGDGGHEVEALACGTEAKPRCPFRADCRYFQQFSQPGPRVGAAEQLFNKHFLAGGVLAVVDDADLARSMVERYFISTEDIARAIKLLKGKKREPFRRFLAILGHAILEAPASGSDALTGAAGWDYFAHTARLYGHDFVQLIDSLPKQPSLPEPSRNEDGVLTRDTVESAAPAKLIRLLDALRDELPYFLTNDGFNSRLRLSSDGIELRRLKEHARDRWGQPVIGQMDLLVLDATPVEALVDHLAQHHDLLPDLAATARLPDGVSVTQYATSTNGHTVLRAGDRVQAVIAEIVAERQKRPVDTTAKEGAVCYRSLRSTLVEAGFAESQVVTFGSVRGTNALAGVERLHVIGRPMPPIAELPYLAQVIHFGEDYVSGQVLLRPQAYAGQPYEVDVIDYSDPRLAALLKAAREDEVVQAVHRGRLFDLDGPQLHLVRGGEEPAPRRQVHLVLHTSQPVPGLRVDELILRSEARNVNAERHDQAKARIVAAAEELLQVGEPLTVAAVLRLSGGSRTTVTKVLREGVHTLKKDLLYKGAYTPPETKEAEPSPSPPEYEIVAPVMPLGREPCRGGCGKPVPPGQMCFYCATWEVEEWIQKKKRRRTA